MISESLVHLGEKKSGIRELFEYGLRQAEGGLKHGKGTYEEKIERWRNRASKEA